MWSWKEALAGPGGEESRHPTPTSLSGSRHHLAFQDFSRAQDFGKGRHQEILAEFRDACSNYISVTVRVMSVNVIIILYFLISVKDIFLYK